MIYQLHAPMVNVNEDEIELVEWHKKEDQLIKKGELLATFESTKSTYEWASPADGFFYPIVGGGARIQVGQVIGYLTEIQGASFEVREETGTSSTKSELTEPAWTRKARMLADRNHLDRTAIETSANGHQITEQIVLDYIAHQNTSPLSIPRSENVNRVERVLILGGGNVAVLVIDILTRIPRQTPVGILDDNPALHGSSILGVPVMGGLQSTQALYEQGLFDAAALAIGILPARKAIFEDLTGQGIPFTNIIDPTAVIGINSCMGTGNMLMAFCRLGPEAVIGDNNFLSAYVNIEHHNRMGSHCTFGPSVYTSGGVQIGSMVKFGTGIHIEPRLTIGDNATIASGVTVTTNIPANIVVKTKANFAF
jgi:sugar O-acyltransferase (sialic acid O-acetyltransferase NeuD family)